MFINYIAFTSYANTYPSKSTHAYTKYFAVLSLAWWLNQSAYICLSFCLYNKNCQITNITTDCNYVLKIMLHGLGNVYVTRRLIIAHILLKVTNILQITMIFFILQISIGIQSILWLNDDTYKLLFSAICNIAISV